MPRSLTLAVVLCLAAIAGCTTTAPTVEVESTSPLPEGSPPSLTATPSPTAPQPSATASPSATETTVADLTMDWVIPFTLTVPGDWAQGGGNTANAMDIVDGSGARYVLSVIRKSPDAPEVWVERLTTAEPLEATEPEPVEIGGAPGHVFD
ncbi:MAG TPA: hypothetical protein VK845_00155, partial [Gemmatimonadales bacterium]|nr:hypothetical protein [Gemmatimonadales bacterium]